MSGSQWEWLDLLGPLPKVVVVSVVPVLSVVAALAGLAWLVGMVVQEWRAVLVVVAGVVAAVGLAWLVDRDWEAVLGIALSLVVLTIAAGLVVEVVRQWRAVLATVAVVVSGATAFWTMSLGLGLAFEDGRWGLGCPIALCSVAGGLWAGYCLLQWGCQVGS